MNGSRLLAALLARTVAVVLAATTLLVVPAASGSSYAAPERCSATDVVTCSVDDARDGDTDGDGLLDSGDGCPTVASSNPTGCPTASRRAALKWAKAKKRLETRITSPVTACSSRARVALWRVRPQRDVKVVGVTATASGRYRFKVPRGARYYVTVSPSYSSGRAECTKATSRKVLARPGADPGPLFNQWVDKTRVSSYLLFNPSVEEGVPCPTSCPASSPPSPTPPVATWWPASPRPTTRWVTSRRPTT